MYEFDFKRNNNRFATFGQIDLIFFDLYLMLLVTGPMREFMPLRQQMLTSFLCFAWHVSDSSV